MATQNEKKLYEELKVKDISCGNFKGFNNDHFIVFKFYNIQKNFDSLLICEDPLRKGMFKIRLSKNGHRTSDEDYGYDGDGKVNFDSAADIANEIVRIFHLFNSLNCKDSIHCAYSKHDTEVTLFLHRAMRKHTSLKDIGNLKEKDKNAGDDPGFIQSPLGKYITKQLKGSFIDNHKMLWMGWSQEAKSWFAIDCLKLFPKMQEKLKEKPFWKEMGDSIKITKIVITDMKSNETSKKWGKALIGNSMLKNYPFLQPCSTTPSRQDEEVIRELPGAPAEFVVKYDEDGKPIFNPDPMKDFFNNFTERFASQAARELCSLMFEESEEEIENPEEQIVLEPISTTVVGNIPVATQVEIVVE